VVTWRRAQIRRRLRLALPEVQGRPTENLQRPGAPGDQEDRQVQADRARPAVFDLEPGQAGRLLVAEGVRHQPRGPAAPAPRGGRLVSTHKDLEDLPRPMIRRYIIWRNKHAADERLREVGDRANVA